MKYLVEITKNAEKELKIIRKPGMQEVNQIIFSWFPGFLIKRGYRTTKTIGEEYAKSYRG